MRKAQSGGASLSGKVSTIDEANKVMDTYKNLYDMPKKEQKAFTDSFAQAVTDTFNNKKKGYEDSMLKKTNKALKEDNKVAYDQAMSHYNIMMKLLVEERQITTDKYNEFIKVKK